MLRGCIVMLIVLVVGYYLEKHFLSKLGLMPAEILAGVLALGLALIAGSVDGTILMYSRNLGADGTTGKLEEGKLGRVSGQLRLLAPAIVTPLSNRGVLAYFYQMRSATRRSGEHLHAAHMLRGVGMAPCEILTSRGPVRLEGFPSLEHFTATTIDAGTSVPAIAQRLVSKPWQRRVGDELKDYNFTDVEFGLNGGVEDFINHSAAELLLPEEDAAPSPQAVAKKLESRNWTAEETVIVPGMTVTAQGTYHDNPPRLKISRSLFEIQHELRPGDGGTVVKGEVQTQWTGMLVMLLGGLAVHVFVYAAEGRYYKALLAWLEGLE